MNWKRYWLSVVAVFIGRGLVSFLLFAVAFDSIYSQSMPGSRPEGEEVHVAGLISVLAWTLAFVYIFTKGYENKGWKEGIRYGLLVWVFYFIPMLTGYYAYFDLPLDFVLAGMVSGLAESLTAGVLAAVIYKPKS